MSKLYRTAFAAPSGFVATAADAPRPAGAVERKASRPGRPTVTPSRDPKSVSRKPNQAA